VNWNENSCGNDNYGLQCITAKGLNMIVTDIRGGSKVSQISCNLVSTCNNNFDGEFGEL